MDGATEAAGAAAGAPLLVGLQAHASVDRGGDTGDAPLITLTHEAE